jgi:hypothetical protein
MARRSELPWTGPPLSCYRASRRAPPAQEAGARPSDPEEEIAMRNLLAFAAAAVLTVAGIGWYLGWYKVNTAPQSDGHRRVEIDINSDKVQHDLEKGERRVLDKAQQQLKERAQNSSPVVTPAAATTNGQ